MNTTLRLTSTVLMILLLSLDSLASTDGMRWNRSWNAETRTLEDAATDRCADWMADLPDNMFVSHVSIPGAHDFATGEGWMAKSAITGPNNSTCQSAKMQELIDGGIRGLDIRPGYYNLWPNKNLYFCHGTDITDVTFQSGMQTLVDFLEAHPTEFFVIHVFKGNNGRNSDKAAEIYKSVLENFQSHVIDFKPNLTVGETRGKMVLLVRDSASYLQYKSQADMLNWQVAFNDDQRPGRMHLHGNENLSTRIHVQDISSNSEGDNTLKATHLENLLRYSQAQDTPAQMYELNGYYTSEWVMNFASKQSSLVSSSSNYKSNSKVFNKQIVEYLSGDNLGRGPLGIVLADYLLTAETSGDALVYKVIENNFTGGADAPVVRYAIDPAIDWDLRPDNEFEGKRLFLRNVGASEDMNQYKYFGGGAEWGSHAVATDAGHEVSFVKGDNGLRIVSPFGALQNKDGAYYLDPTDGDDNNGTEFVLSRTYWDGYPVYHITGQVSHRRLEARQYNEGENIFYDQPKYTVFPAEPSDDPHQLWQIIALSPDDEVAGITIEGHDRISRLKEKANPQRGMDATFLIPAYSFGNGDKGIDKWNVAAGSNITAGQNATDRGGMWRAFNTQPGNNTFSISTIVDHLPRGHYVLEFQYLSTGSGVTYRLGDRTPEPLPANSGGVAGIISGGDNVAEAGAWFADNPDNGRVVFAFDKVTDEHTTRELVFSRQEDENAATSFYLDNLRLTYYGDNVSPTVIELTFPHHWNTMMLPFEANAPADLQVMEAIDMSDKGNYFDENGPFDYHIVKLGDPVNTIRANYPYVVRNPAKNPAQPAKRRAAEQEEKLYTFTGYPTNRKNDYRDDAQILTGLTEPRGLQHNNLAYILRAPSGEGGFQWFNRHDGEEICLVEGRRAYVNGRTAPKLTEAPRVYFNMQGVPASITDVAEESSLTPDTPVSVFSPQGILLKQSVTYSTALAGLSSGVYIVATPIGVLKLSK